MNEEEQAAVATQTLRIGEIVAEKYRIERLIGCGGMAEVYAAVNIRTERRVALKWVLPILANNREVMLRFRREALAAGRIVHPNVVAIFDVVEHQSSACMVMELLDGEMLSDRLVRLGPLPFAEAVAIILPAMRGVAAAHAKKVIHRDLKPHNIFLCLDAAGSIGEVKVLDFGVSKLAVVDAATAGDITLSGNVVGTPEYMAPEQVRSGKGADHRIDIYSLGVVLYEMLAGRPPFVNQHFSGLMLEIMQNEAPPLSNFRPDVPRRLAGVIQRSMARDPERRFGDVSAFIQALEGVARDDLKMLVGTPPEGVLTRAGFPRPTPASTSAPLQVARGGRRGALRVGLAVAGLALLAAGFAARARRRPGPADSEQARPAAATSGLQPAPAPHPIAASTTVQPTLAPPPRTLPTPAAEAAPRLGSTETGLGPDPHVSAGSGARRRGPRAPRERAGVGGDPTESGAVARPAGTAPAIKPQPPRAPRAGKLSVDDF